MDAARVLTHTKPWQDITPNLIHLLWLPVKPSRDYKILLLTYKSLHALASQHLSDLILPCSAPRNHQFLDTGPLSISHTRLRTFGVISPTLWEKLYLLTFTAPPHLWPSVLCSSQPHLTLPPCQTLIFVPLFNVSCCLFVYDTFFPPLLFLLDKCTHRIKRKPQEPPFREELKV